MPQFTQLNLQNKSNPKPQPARREFVGRQTLALFAAASLATVLIAGLLLETSGCSRENDTAVSAAIQRPAIQPVSTTSAPVPESAVAPAPVARNVAKKRVTPPALYSDKTYGVSFTYPKRYALKSADPSKPDATTQTAMNFIQPGGLDVVTVELPKNSYPHTDLASASFRISVNPSLTSEQCGQFALLNPAPSDKPTIVPAKIKLAGLDLTAMEAVSGTETSQSDSKYYHAFANGACYEFSLGLSTQAQAKDKDAEPKENEEPAPAVDRTVVFRRLQNILATVKIEPVSAPAASAFTEVPPTPATAAPEVAGK